MSVRGVILVRHAMPEVVRGVAPRLWGLGKGAAEDCVLLAHALPGELASSIHTSEEKKAEQTAALIAMRRGLTLTIDPRLAEVDRPDEWIDDHRAMAAAYLGGAEHAGWEPRDAVMSRFAEAVERARAAAPSESDVVIVNHGMALSLFVELVARVDIVSFWRALTFPDAWHVDLETGELVRLYSGAPAPDA